MHRPEIMQRMYETLANRFAKQGDPRQRDHFLVLAADAALLGARPDEAERLRQQLLRYNPHHLLRPYASMTEAMQSSDVQDYVGDLRLQWPAEQAEKLLGGPLPDEPLPPPPPPPPAKPALAKPAPLAPPLPGPKNLPNAPPLAKPSPYLKLPTREASAASPLPSPASASPPEPPASGPGRVVAIVLFLLMLSMGGGMLFLAFVWPLLR